MCIYAFTYIYIYVYILFSSFLVEIWSFCKNSLLLHLLMWLNVSSSSLRYSWFQLEMDPVWLLQQNSFILKENSLWYNNHCYFFFYQFTTPCSWSLGILRQSSLSFPLQVQNIRNPCKILSSWLLGFFTFSPLKTFVCISLHSPSAAAALWRYDHPEWFVLLQQPWAQWCCSIVIIIPSFLLSNRVKSLSRYLSFKLLENLKSLSPLCLQSVTNPNLSPLLPKSYQQIFSNCKLTHPSLF